jgi:AcrR family transcriptional regulator
MAISQENLPPGSPAKGVRERLLEVAEEFFCERGFDGTSVRDLAGAAGCNVASVNYYYGGKEKLYEEVWRRYLVSQRDSRVANAFVGSLADQRVGRRFIKLMARELIDPHLPSEIFGEDVIKPTLLKMQQALAKACPGLDESKVPLVVFSLVGQLIHTIRIKPILRWTDDEALAVFAPARLVDHIVAFSAAGIRAYAERKTE